MAEVLLFHHAQGLTRGVEAFADDLRKAGHRVHCPDLYEGRTFENIDQGVEHARGIGFENIIKRGARVAQSLPAELVYAGFSMGVLPAQYLAQTRSGARGALLFHSCIQYKEFSDSWPQGVSVQIHSMDADPFFVDEGDIEAAKALVESGAPAELFLYPGSAHLFADSSLKAYSPEASALLKSRVLAFLESR